MNDTILYCGPESQARAYTEHLAQARAMAPNRELPVTPPYSLQGGVAVIDISGSLVNGSAGFMSLFGYTGYADIRNSLVAAVSDQSVGSILLNVDSGGGQVAGVHELAQLVSRIDKIKPVVTYTGGTMASAALWLGAGGRKLVANETSMVGSIGVMQVHMDYTRQMENEGVKATVVRSVPEKALANQFEPLSESARAEMEEQAKEMHSVFLGHVATQRGLSDVVAQDKFGTGRVFVGKQALAAGLVDEIGGYETAYSAALKYAEKALSKTAKRAMPSNLSNVRAEVAGSAVADVSAAHVAAHNTPIETPTKNTTMQEDLSPEALAALAGVDLSAEVAVDTSTTQAVTAVADVSADLTALQEKLVAAEALAAAAQAEVATAKAAEVAAKAELESLKSASAAEKPQFDAALEVARASVRTMGLQFGVSAESVAAMSAAEVLENHKSLAEKFRAKFKVDRVAAINSNTKPEHKDSTNPSSFMAPAMASVAMSLPGAL